MPSSPPPAIPDPLPAVLLVLTATTGLVDAVSILGLGHVFTANMTGNVVFLGFAAAGDAEFSAPRCVAAVLAFLVGAVLGGRIVSGMRGATAAAGCSRRLRWNAPFFWAPVSSRERTTPCGWRQRGGWSRSSG